MKKQPMVLTGTVGMDDHVIGTKIVSRALREAGFGVTALGANTSPEQFIKAAQETDADAIFMTSNYGMAQLDLQGFNEKRIEAGLGDVLLYIGGNLMIGRKDFNEVEETFKKLGFDRVYPPGSETVDTLAMGINDLIGDLKGKAKM
jgi:methylaspartate mutase S subunit